MHATYVKPKMQRSGCTTVLTCMTSLPPLHPRDRSEGGYSVRRPQAGDVLSGALRSAYGNGVGLPDDMQRLLVKLNHTSMQH